MDLLRYTASRFPAVHLVPPRLSPSRRRSLVVRSCFPFPEKEAKYYKELQAAVDVVERACNLCVDVKKSLYSSDEGILRKNDQTPVTVADFGVQALISLELCKLFPSIPLVAEEDSGFLRSSNLITSVVNAVKDKTNLKDKELTQDDVLEAIDRGGKEGSSFGPEPATYWILDPIDGTAGFLKGGDALYVIGLALVVKGEIVLGVMGCPNWQEGNFENPPCGTIMAAHVDCGTWRKTLWEYDFHTKVDSWSDCYIDFCDKLRKACFCIQDSREWESLPISKAFSGKTGSEVVGKNDIILLPTCCGSLCKYLMVASGRASGFMLRARPQKTIMAWDHAAGAICVREAVGEVTDWNGKEIDFAADEVGRRIINPPGGVLVANWYLVKEIITTMKASFSPV